MAGVKFDEKYVSAELASPVTLYLIGGAAMIKYGLKAATKDIDDGMGFFLADLKTYSFRSGRGGRRRVGGSWAGA